MKLCSGSQQIEWLTVDFIDELHTERRNFTLAYKHAYVTCLTQAQGSVNAPIVCGRVAALLSRLTQALFSDRTLRLQLPRRPHHLRAGQQRFEAMAIILFWFPLGVRLAYKKASGGSEIQWIGAKHTALAQNQGQTRIEVRAKAGSIQEVKEMTWQHEFQNVCPRKGLQTYVGKLNRMAGIVEVNKMRITYKSAGLTLIAREMALRFRSCCYKPRALEHIPGVSIEWADILSWFCSFWGRANGRLERRKKRWLWPKGLVEARQATGVNALGTEGCAWLKLPRRFYKVSGRANGRLERRKKRGPWPKGLVEARQAAGVNGLGTEGCAWLKLSRRFYRVSGLANGRLERRKKRGPWPKGLVEAERPRDRGLCLGEAAAKVLQHRGLCLAEAAAEDGMPWQRLQSGDISW
eukprot:s2500_g6.t1